MWEWRLQDAWHHGKRAMGNVFNHAVKWTGQIDHAMKLVKRVFGALQPAIHDMGGSHSRIMDKTVMQGIQGYDQGRNDVMGHRDQVQAHLSRLRRAAPELDP